MQAPVDRIAMRVLARAEAAGRRSGGAAAARTALGRDASAALAILLSLTISAGAASDAFGADWAVSGTVSETVEVNTNRDLDGEPDPIYGSTTRLGLNATGQTKTSTWALQTGAAARAFGGSGDTKGLNRIDPYFRGNYARDGKRLDIGANLSADYQPVAFSQLDETGVTTGDATQFTVQFGTNAAYALDPRNRLAVGANVSLIRFLSGETSLEPTTTIGGSLGWVRSLSPTTTFDLTFGTRRFTAGGETPREQLTFDLQAGMQHRVNSRLSIEGGIGVSATETDSAAGGSGDGYDLGATGDLGIAWQPVADTAVSFSFSHGVEPSSIGALRTLTALTLGVDHAVNDWTAVGATLGWSRRSNIGQSTRPGAQLDDERNLLRAGTTIDFSLARSWQLGLGYTLTVSTDSGGDALTNRVFMQLTHPFQIIP